MARIVTTIQTKMRSDDYLDQPSPKRYGSARNDHDKDRLWFNPGVRRRYA